VNFVATGPIPLSKLAQRRVLVLFAYAFELTHVYALTLANIYAFELARGAETVEVVGLPDVEVAEQMFLLALQILRCLNILKPIWLF